MLDFPISPVNGQTYIGPNGIQYTYSSADGAWTALSPGGGGSGVAVIVSPTPPSIGLPEGSLYWNTELGILFVLYDDGNTVQWVQSVPSAGGLPEYNIVTTGIAYTAQPSDYVVVENAGLTITLPLNPTPGNRVVVVVAGSFLNTVVARNGQNIMGLAENITLDKPYAAMQFTYVNSLNGWRLN